MKIAPVAMMLIALSGGGVAAQEVVDGSEKMLNSDQMKLVVGAMRDQMLDGYSAKISYLSVRKGNICGFVNGKNSVGAFAGNVAFRIEIASGATSFMPPAGDAMHDLSELTFHNIGCPTSI